MIQLQAITKDYLKGKQTNTVLKDVNLVIDRGEMVAIQGRSGAGKSTLLHILAGIEQPTNGTYFWSGAEMTKKTKREMALWRRKQVGLVFQNHALIEEKSVLDNVALPLMYQGIEKETREKKVRELLTELDLIEKIHQYPSELSGGQAQRVAIARALVGNPTLLLADEPTGSVDEETRDIILAIFRERNQKGTTIILVTHDNIVASTCERKISLQNGVIVEAF